MTPEEFVSLFRRHRDELLTAYLEKGAESEVAERIRSLELPEEKLEELGTLIEAVLDDAHYGILLGLDGAASLGGLQQGFTICADDGTLVSAADDGELEGPAFEAFHSGGA